MNDVKDEEEKDESYIDYSDELYSEHVGIAEPIQRESAWQMKGFLPGHEVNSKNRSLR